MTNDRYVFIYGYQKANFMVQNGLELIEIGKGKVDGIFFKFLKTDKSWEVAQRWKKLNGFED